MKTVTCPECQHVNAAADANAVCAACGEPLGLAMLEQSVAEIKKLNERMREINAPSFNSYNGIGTTLLDYRELPDGTWEATRWVTVVLPIVPLAAYRIEPKRQEHSYGRQQSYFTVLGKRPLSLPRVLRVYALVFVGLFPIVWGSLNSSLVNRTLGGVPAFFAMLACVAWAAYIVLWKLKNDSRAYKAKAVTGGAGRAFTGPE